jgi:2-iminobutanoate/2-iminopropanoate deaminase
MMALKGLLAATITGVVIMTANAQSDQNARSDRKFLTSKLATERQLPFSAGVLLRDTLYISGNTVDPAKIAAGISPEQEARELMEQVKKTVEQAGMTMDDVVSVQVFCTNLSFYNAFNSVYKTYFRSNFPARAFIGVGKLLFGARYELNGIAVAHK